MAKIDTKDLTAQELVAKDRELRQELFNLRLQQATARLEKPHQLRTLRRDVARLQTRLTAARAAAAATKSKA